MSESVIEVSELTRRFGARTALASVSLSMSRGAVYGLVGANGAGKTTLIRHVLGLLRAESGSVRVFGLDPVADPVAVLSRIGYLSEENDIPGWMRVDELIRYSRATPPGTMVTPRSCGRNSSSNPRRRSGTSPRDRRPGRDCSSPWRIGPSFWCWMNRRPVSIPSFAATILGAVLRTIADEGRTVLFSSHLLEEVEQVADHVTMIHQGTIALSAPLREIKESHRVGEHVPTLAEIFVAQVGMAAAPPPEA